jgi:hypothetical protein
VSKGSGRFAASGGGQTVIVNSLLRAILTLVPAVQAPT